MSEDYSHLIPDFVNESNEHLDNIENDILSFEQKQANQEFDKDLINSIFRAIHSIKGAASFIELHHIERLSHRMEDILDLIRNQKIKLNSNISNALLHSIDMLKNLLEKIEVSNNIDIDIYIAELDQALESQLHPELKHDLSKSTQINFNNTIFEFDVNHAKLKNRFASGYVYLIDIDLIEDIEKQHLNPLILVKEMNSLGELLDTKINLMDIPEDLEEDSKLPLKVIYYSAMEKEMVSYALKINEDKITQLDASDFQVKNEAPHPVQPKITNSSAPAPSVEIPAQEDDTENENFLSENQNIESIEEPRVNDPEETQAIDIEKNRDYITFMLNSEEYGIEILNIHEIIGYQIVSKIPNVPPYIKGMINLRGNIVPVFDMREKFGMTNRDINKFTVVIIVEIQNKTIGLIVDSVSDIVTFHDHDIQEALVTHHGINLELIRGVGKKEKHMIILLNLDRLISTIFNELAACA